MLLIEFIIFLFMVISIFSFMSKSQWLLIWTMSFLFSSLTPFNGAIFLADMGLNKTDSLFFLMALFSLWSIMISFWKWGPLTNTFYLRVILSLMILVIYSFFMATKILIFYLMFEASLIPIFLIVLGWGYQPERVSAAFNLLLYTIFGSMPLLVSIMTVFKFNLELITDIKLSSMLGPSLTLLPMFSLAAFLIKLPIFSVHHWLPKAHVEAPVFGSMILASILLKLGGYGIFRFTPIFLDNKMINFVFSLTVLGGVIVSFLCLRQMDMKIMIAYSSVAHMSFVLGGFLALNHVGLKTGLGMMIAHGFVSSGMFAGADLIYKQFSTRAIPLIKGMINFMPLFSLLWFILNMGNMGTPPSLNFMSEVCGVITFLSFEFFFMISILILGGLAVGFSLILYAHSQHGFNLNKWSNLSLSHREVSMLIFHIVPVYFMVMNFSYIV